MTFTASAKGWQIWVTLEQQRSMCQSAPPGENPAAHSTASPQELWLGTVAPACLQQGGSSPPMGHGSQIQPLGSTAPLDIPGTFMLFLTDAISFPFSFPRMSPLLWEWRVRTLSFLHFGSFLLTWQYVKYGLAWESIDKLFLTNHHLILPYYHLTFSYCHCPFASCEANSIFVIH